MGRLGAVEYLGHQLLLSHQKQRGMVPKTVFHKLWCISARYLEDEEGIDIGLPRYWYKYGEIVDEESVNDDFYGISSAPWGGRAYKPVWELDSDDFHIEPEEKETIDHTVKWTLNRFKLRRAPYLESYQYSVYSPNEFIRAYSELREHLQNTDLESQEVFTQHASRPEFDVESNRELVTEYLDLLVLTYPENEDGYNSFQDLFLRWDDTARLILKQDEPYEQLEDFLDEFVEVLSKAVLQMKYNENIPEERLGGWASKADQAVSDFEEYLENYRAELLAERKMSGVLDSVADTYDETVISDLEQDR